MSPTIAAIDPVNATFFLAILVLVGAFTLAVIGASSKQENSENGKYLFGVVGVMLGLFGAGGLGALFANQAADEAAKSAATQVAPKAANAAATQVSEEVGQQVEAALEASPGGAQSDGGAAKP